MKMQNAKTIYDDDLAYIHDVGFSRLAERWAPGLLGIIHKTGINEGLVVDLGCGGGVWVYRRKEVGELLRSACFRVLTVRRF